MVDYDRTIPNLFTLQKLEIDFQFICNSQKYEIHFQLVKPCSLVKIIYSN